MTTYSVRDNGGMFVVHADDSGYNVVGYSKKKRARRRAQLLNFEDALTHRLSDEGVSVSDEAMKIILEVAEQQFISDKENPHE